MTTNSIEGVPAVEEILARTELIIRPGEFVLVGLEPKQRPRLEAELSSFNSSFFQYTVEPEVLTLLVESEGWQRVGRYYAEARVEGPLRVFSFSAAMDWQVVGFLATVTGLLARAGVPLGAVCGYSRDHLFIAVEHAAHAEAILRTEIERCARRIGGTG